MRIEAVQQLARSLPGVTEAPHFDKRSFRVGGKIFATIPPDEDHIHIFVDEHAVRAMVAEDPETFEELRWGKRLMGVRVSLARADDDVVFTLLQDAWRLRAGRACDARATSEGS